MQVEIPLSVVKSLPFDFDAEVEAYRAARQAHAKTIGEPAPVPKHPLIAEAVLRLPPPPDPDEDNPDGEERFVANYHIVDDTPEPPAPPSALEIRASKHLALMDAANKARERVLPQLKRRMVHVNRVDADEEFRRLYDAAAPEVGADRAAAVAKSQLSPAAVQANAAFDDLQMKDRAIERHLASQEVALHDVADDAVGSWGWAAFPY